MNSKQKGSGTITVLIILVVAAIIGGIGYYVYTSNKSTNDMAATQKSKPVQSSRQSQSTGTSAGSNQQSEVKYLEIDELNIRVKLTSETSDLTYHLGPVNPNGVRWVAFGLASFTTESEKYDHLTDSDGRNSCENRASITLYPTNQRWLIEQDPIMPHKFDANGKPLDDINIRQLADKRYVTFSGPQATCIKDGSETIYDKETQVRSILHDTLFSNLSTM